MSAAKLDIVNPSLIKLIFLADDDLDDLEIFQSVLKEVNPMLTLRHFANGLEVLRALTESMPDLLFLDLDMPKKNGMETLRDIRNNPHTAKLPVVVFSSSSRQSTIDTAYEMGADLFFVKSADYQRIVHCLEAIFELNWSDAECIKLAQKTGELYRALM